MTRMNWKSTWRVTGLALVAVLFLTACKPNPETRETQYFADMYRNPAVKQQEEYLFFRTGSGMAVPPDHTISRNFTPYPYKIIEGPKAGEELKNPLPMTREVLEIGHKYFNIHCIVCHGPVGAGDGLATVAKREKGMPIPPPLYGDKIQGWKDGEIYHTITLGQGQMPGYATRLDPMHRWAIVNYVRALGMAASPSPEDLEAVKKLGWDARSMDSPLRNQDPAEMLEKKSIFTVEHMTNND